MYRISFEMLLEALGSNSKLDRKSTYPLVAENCYEVSTILVLCSPTDDFQALLPHNILQILVKNVVEPTSWTFPRIRIRGQTELSCGRCAEVKTRRSRNEPLSGPEERRQSGPGWFRNPARGLGFFLCFFWFLVRVVSSQQHSGLILGYFLFGNGSRPLLECRH